MQATKKTFQRLSNTRLHCYSNLTKEHKEFNYQKLHQIFQLQKIG